MLALISYTETERRRWLWIAGLCAGLSFLVKIVALYFGAAALMFFIFRELHVSQSSPGPRGSSPGYKAFASGGLLLFMVALADMILKRPTVPEVFHFVLPSGCLVAVLLWLLWRGPSSGSWPRFRSLFSMILPFASGAALPVLAFLAYSAKVGALGDWVSGVLGLSEHIYWTSVGPPPPVMAVGLLPGAAVLAFAYHRKASVRRAALLVAVGLLGVSLVLARVSLFAYIALGMSLPVLIPVIAIAAFSRFRHRPPVQVGRREITFLVVAAAVLCALIQFPFSVPIYLCYVAPLAVLAITALLSTLPAPNRPALGALVLFYLVFAVWLRTPGFFNTMGFSADKPYSFTRLDLPRAGGIRVRPDQAREYEKLIPLIQSHADGPYAYCTPDCPQIDFLSGLTNPTPTILDFLDRDYFDPPMRVHGLLRALALLRVRVVALGPNQATVSGVISPALRAVLDGRYPVSERVGRYEVRWIGPAPARGANPGNVGDAAGVGPEGPDLAGAARRQARLEADPRRTGWRAKKYHFR